MNKRLSTLLIAVAIGGLLHIDCHRRCVPAQAAAASDPSKDDADTSGTAAVPSEAPPDTVWDRQRPEFEEIAKQLQASTNDYFGTRQVPLLRQQLNRPEQSKRQTLGLQLALCWHLLRLGDVDAAVEQINRSETLAQSLSPIDPEVSLRMHRLRALCYLRQAEVANCIRQHNRDCCIFPLRRGGVHDHPVPAREARRSLLAALESKPDDLISRWLLNIVVMALRDYPQGVPGPYLIGPAAFESDYDIGRFVDVAPQLGLAKLNLCGGVTVDDFDGDGHLDIVTSTHDPSGPLTYYHNLGNGQFKDASASSRLDDQLGGLNCLSADYDNDGDADILVLRGAWLFSQGRIRNSLLNNNGDGTFTDVTRPAGLADPAYPTQAAVWGDFDNDGDLDLFIGNEARVERPRSDADCYPSQLFNNNGDGTFTDIADRAGVTNLRAAKAVATGDYDNDGDLDLYVSNMGTNRFYRNNGNRTFTDIAPQLGLTEPRGRSFACWFFDYDNDGDLDLFVAAYQASTTDIAADYLNQPHRGILPRMYKNDGNGRFTDVARQVGLDHPYLPMGANFGDLDNDGYLDFYLATGDPGYASLMPNIMLRNDRGQAFQDVTTSGGFGHLQKGHGVAFADIDNDGDQDIYHQLGGFYPGDAFQNVLFLNPGHGNHYLIVQLKGVTTNRRGVGARLKVVVQTPQGPAQFHRAAGSVSSFGGSPMRQEIGLGDATRIERLEIQWPTSQTTQVLTEVPIDTVVTVTEGAPGFETGSLERIQLH